MSLLNKVSRDEDLSNMRSLELFEWLPLEEPSPDLRWVSGIASWKKISRQQRHLQVLFKISTVRSEKTAWAYLHLDLGLVKKVAADQLLSAPIFIGGLKKNLAISFAASIESPHKSLALF